MQQLAQGTVVGDRYQVERVIGQGGFGAVYQAIDTRFNRPVALKEMGQGSLDPQELAKGIADFKREALLLAGLTHPNLPHIYDQFPDAGRWYLVMDFIEGQTLEKHLEQASDGKLPVEEALSLGIQLCRVLDYLHTRQPPIIFRDLKPDNVMLTADRHLYLIDFGIARHFKPGQAKDTIAFGSPGYAAPEQYGRRQTTPQADIYSLGATLHQMLTGNDPAHSPFHFAPLRLPPQPALARLEPLLRQMLEIDENKRPPSIIVVKKELQGIAAQFGAPGAEGSAQPVPAPLVSAQDPFCPNCGSVSRSTSRYCGRCGASMPAPSPGSSALPGPINRTPPVLQPLPTILTGHTWSVNSVAFSPDGRLLASGSGDKTFRLWDVGSGALLQSFKEHKASITSLAFSRAGTSVQASKRSAEVESWPQAIPRGSRELAAGHAAREHGSAQPNYILASASYDATIKLWNVTGSSQGNESMAPSTSLYRILTSAAGWVYSVAFSTDGRSLACGFPDTTVKLWDVGSGNLVDVFTGHSGTVSSVAFSPDGRTLASGSFDHTIKLWNVATGKSTYTLLGHTNWVRSLAFSPDGQILASGSDDETIKLWDMKMVQAQRAVRPTASQPPAQTGLDEGGTKLAASLTPLCTLRGHTSSVYAVAFSPDGRTLASGSGDYTIMLWDVPGSIKGIGSSSGSKAPSYNYSTLKGHTGKVTALAFSPVGTGGVRPQSPVKLGERSRLRGTNGSWANGERGTDAPREYGSAPPNYILASGSGDNTIRLWRL